MLGYQAMFDEDVSEVVYKDVNTGELLSTSFTGALDRVFEDQNPATEVNAVTTRETIYKDAVTGQPLQWPLVAAARKLELAYFESKKVLLKRLRTEAFTRTGRPAISVRWIDTNKGDDDNPNYRSRLVAREIRRRGE